MMNPNGIERGSVEGRSALDRLELALDRISGAVVRRLEQDAVHGDQAPLHDDGPAPCGGDNGRTDEVRQRLDALILRLRHVLAETEGDAAR